MPFPPADRLPALRQTLNLSTEEFAYSLDLPVRRARRILRPTYQPCVGLLARVRRSFPQVNPDWLLCGEGDMLLAAPASTGNSIENNYGTVHQTVNHYHFIGLPTGQGRSLLIGILKHFKAWK